MSRDDSEKREEEKTKRKGKNVAFFVKCPLVLFCGESAERAVVRVENMGWDGMGRIARAARAVLLVPVLEARAGREGDPVGEKQGKQSKLKKKRDQGSGRLWRRSGRGHESRGFLLINSLGLWAASILSLLSLSFTERVG
jgi:hypothetical protein